MDYIKIKYLDKPKKIKRSTLKNKCDRLFSQKVRDRDVCQLAGVDRVTCNGGLQCAHIIGRANHRLRWDLKNALSLCSGHHMYYTNNPWEWQEIIKKRYPSNYRYVNKYRNEIWDKDLEGILEDLEIGI